MDIKSYWKAYHSKNRDKINEARRKRYKIERIEFGIEYGTRTGVILDPIRSEDKPTREAMAPSKPVEPPKSTSAGKCIYCWSTDTEIKTINGGPYPVCLKHRNKP